MTYYLNSRNECVKLKKEWEFEISLSLKIIFTPSEANNIYLKNRRNIDIGEIICYKGYKNNLRTMPARSIITISLCILLMNLSLASSTIVQKFVREPPDQTAAEGEHVTLPCRVDNKIGPLQWTRDDFGLGLNRNLKGFER